MQPLLWEMTPGYTEVVDGENLKPLRANALKGYYRLWGRDVQQQYYLLGFFRRVEILTESMEQQTPFLGADGPDSGR